jgi:hypothetical protein
MDTRGTESATLAQGKGDAKKARATAERAADFNGLSPNCVFVRAKAKELLATGG